MKVYAIEINTIAIVCCVPLSEVDANSQSLPAADTTDRVSDACKGNSYTIELQSLKILLCSRPSRQCSSRWISSKAHEINYGKHSVHCTPSL